MENWSPYLGAGLLVGCLPGAVRTWATWTEPPCSLGAVCLAALVLPVSASSSATPCPRPRIPSLATTTTRMKMKMTQIPLGVALPGDPWGLSTGAAGAGRGGVTRRVPRPTHSVEGRILRNRICAIRHTPHQITFCWLVVWCIPLLFLPPENGRNEWVIEIILGIAWCCLPCQHPWRD